MLGKVYEESTIDCLYVTLSKHEQSGVKRLFFFELFFSNPRTTRCIHVDFCFLVYIAHFCFRSSSYTHAWLIFFTNIHWKKKVRTFVCVKKEKMITFSSLALINSIFQIVWILFVRQRKYFVLSGWFFFSKRAPVPNLLLWRIMKPLNL